MNNTKTFSLLDEIKKQIHCTYQNIFIKHRYELGVSEQSIWTNQDRQDGVCDRL